MNELMHTARMGSFEIEATFKPDAFERTVAMVSPGWARSRMMARLGYMEAQRLYEGATKGRRTKGWRTGNTSARAEVAVSAAVLRDRARALCRDNAFAAKGKSVLVTAMIGSGIRASFHGTNKRSNEKKAARWKRWAESTECDATRKHNFYGLQRLVVSTMVESGEALILEEIVPGQKIPLALRVLEPDHVDTAKNEDLGATRGRIINGREFDARGKLVAMWVYPQHPGDATAILWNTIRQSVRIPTSEIISVFRVERPGQDAGVSWFAPVLLRIRDLDEYMDAALMRVKIANCTVAFVTAEGGTPGGVAAVSEKMVPGAIEILPPGRSVTMSNPPPITGLESIILEYLREIAAGLGISAEALSGNLSKVNFSSGRMGWIDMYRNVEDWRWNTLEPQFLSRVIEWFDRVTLISTGEDLSTVEVRWTPPRREMLNPKEEIEALILAIRGGLCSLSEGLRSLGYEPETVLNELKNDFDLLKQMGLVLDIDPSQTTQQGQLQSLASGDKTGDVELKKAIMGMLSGSTTPVA